MKRDARIGLAVVLVLGLAVTLLIARSFCKRGNETASADADSAAPRGAAAYTTDVARVDGIDAAQVSAAAAATPSSATPAPAGDTAARAAETPNPALKAFAEDQTRRLAAEAQPATAKAPPVIEGAAPAGATADNNSKPAADGTQPAHAGNQVDHTALLDHEQSGPPALDHKPPADGFAYTVASGDNIWKISAKVYGDGKYTQKIIEANAGLNTLKMKPGALIRIPVITNKTILMKLPTYADAKKARSSGSTEVADRAKAHSPDSAAGPATAAKSVASTDKVAGAGAATTHKVEAGETLSGIAKKYLGANGPKTIAMIAAANKGLDPAKLKVGQEITIPPKK